MEESPRFSWLRSLCMGVVLALHAGVLLLLSQPIGVSRETSVDPLAPRPESDATVAVSWFDRERPRDVAIESPMRNLPVPTSNPAPRLPPERASEPESRPSIPRSRIAAASDSEPPVATLSAEAAALLVPPSTPYFDKDARARLPNEPVYAAAPPPRAGDYYTPGDGSEDDVFYRPLALDPDPSRFAYAWQPRGNLMDDWLGRLVEFGTGTLTIPLNPKFNLVCAASPLGGGCLIVRNGGTGVIVQRPPPAPWERSNRVQCRELRDALDTADEAERVAYLIERLSALCSGAQNDEAQREAGLQESNALDRPPAAN